MPQAKTDYAKQIGLQTPFLEGWANIQRGGTLPPHMSSRYGNQCRFDRPGHSREHPRLGGITRSDGGDPFQSLTGDMSQKSAQRVMEIAHAPPKGLKTLLGPTNRCRSNPPPLGSEGFPFSGLQLLSDGETPLLPFQ